MPDRSMMGRSTTKLYTITCCIFLATAEMERPIPTQERRNTAMTRARVKREPTRATLNHATAIVSTMKDWTIPIRSGGTAFPMSISMGRSGVTMSWSKVPFSLSLATDSPARIITCVRLTMGRSDARNPHREIRFGLYHATGSIWRS